MKYLIILILFITSCTDKKQTTEPIVIEPKPIIAEVIKPEPIKLSYDKGLDLMLVDTSFNSTISCILRNADEGLEYYAVYWDTNHDSYYITSNDIVLLYPIPVTNTNFVYTVDESKQIEPVFDSSLLEIFPDTKAPLLYIGSVSPLERVYLDPTNQVYYIKYLTFFDTSTYRSHDKENSEVTNSNSSPVYPIIMSNINNRYDNNDILTNQELILNTYFTNTNNQFFSIPPYNSDEFPTLYRNTFFN